MITIVKLIWRICKQIYHACTRSRLQNACTYTPKAVSGLFMKRETGRTIGSRNVDGYKFFIGRMSELLGCQIVELFTTTRNIGEQHMFDEY